MIPNPDGQNSSKRGYQETPPLPIDELGMPMVAPNGDTDDPDPPSSKSCSSKDSRKKPKAVDADDDVTMDGSVKSTRTTRSKAEREAEHDLRARKKTYSQ